MFIKNAVRVRVRPQHSGRHPSSSNKQSSRLMLAIIADDWIINYCVDAAGKDSLTEKKKKKKKTY